MSQLVQIIKDNFQELESCLVIQKDHFSTDEIDKNDLVSPWLSWINKTNIEMETLNIELIDESQLLIKCISSSSFLVVHNKSENKTLLYNFILSLDDYKENAPVLEESISRHEEILNDPKMLDAVRIQKLIIPNIEDIKKEFKNFFVVYQQQDLVGGDFYWYAKKDDTVLFAIVDCTGHSVEGAMTSMVCNSLLNQSLDVFQGENPDAVLMKFYSQLSKYNKTTSDILDYGIGAEIGLFAFNHSRSQITFCSTGISAFIRKTDGMELLKSKKAIQYDNMADSISQTTFEMDGVTGIYGFTDGLTDQFDSNDRKKLGRRGVLQMIEREENFDAKYYMNEINKWKGDNIQYDDITFVGIAI
ncbi:PP2C family protein-serine/threonine phosphatase [Marinoscillum sp.]|uniref:PP2C family protein-serine/threonine phosphatase n=1 Tax=Marinoscillum sp. TaxID=2024838 RepID=UPI003BACEF87